MENSIKEIINNSLDQVRATVDADTMIGQPIRTDAGTIIIPVSKISIGMATGGLDIPAKDASGSKNFGGGGGTGVSVSPIGFLTVYPNGAVEMLPIAPTQASPIEQIADIIDHTPDLIARIKSIFTPKEEEIDAEAILAAVAEQEAKDREREEEIRREAAEQARAEAEAAAAAAIPLSKREQKKLEKLQKKEAKKAAKLNKAD